MAYRFGRETPGTKRYLEVMQVGILLSRREFLERQADVVHLEMRDTEVPGQLLRCHRLANARWYLAWGLNHLRVGLVR